MKPLNFILFLLFLTDISFGQDITVAKQKSIFDDTTLIRTNLIEAFKVNERIICFSFGKNAIIYLSESALVDSSSKRLTSNFDYVRTNCKLILGLLRKNKNSDTIFLKDYPQYFKSLVSEQLRNGNARIIDKKTNLFVPFIYQRLERFISTADRVFYFADNRRFFQAQEWSGIIPNELMPDIE